MTTDDLKFTWIVHSYYKTKVEATESQRQVGLETGVYGTGLHLNPKSGKWELWVKVSITPQGEEK